MLVGAGPLGVNGKQADLALGEVRITANKNTIPVPPEKPTIGSGDSARDAAVTSRGMREEEMREIATRHRRGHRGPRRRGRPGGGPRARCGDRGPLPGAGRARHALDGARCLLGKFGRPDLTGVFASASPPPRRLKFSSIPLSMPPSISLSRAATEKKNCKGPRSGCDRWEGPRTRAPRVLAGPGRPRTRRSARSGSARSPRGVTRGKAHSPPLPRSDIPTTT